MERKMYIQEARKKQEDQKERNVNEFELYCLGNKKIHIQWIDFKISN